MFFFYYGKNHESAWLVHWSEIRSSLSCQLLGDDPHLNSSLFKNGSRNDICVEWDVTELNLVIWYVMPLVPCLASLWPTCKFFLSVFTLSYQFAECFFFSMLWTCLWPIAVSGRCCATLNMNKMIDVCLNAALIQLMAAAQARRDICYFTFRNSQFVDDLHEIHKFIRDVQLSVGLYHQTLLEGTQRLQTIPGRTGSKQIEKIPGG